MSEEEKLEYLKKERKALWENKEKQWLNNRATWKMSNIKFGQVYLDENDDIYILLGCYPKRKTLQLRCHVLSKDKSKDDGIYNVNPDYLKKMDKSRNIIIDYSIYEKILFENFRLQDEI